MLNLSKVIKLTSGALIASSLLATSSFAQQNTENSAVGIEVSSPIYEFTVSPGKVQPEIIKIKNVGSSTATYYPEVFDFKSDNKTSSPIILKEGEENGSYSLAKWISISKEPITLEPGVSAARNFVITVPSDAEPGGHYGTILFSTSKPSVEPSNISLANKVGSLILVRVAGDAKESAKITSFTTDKDTYEEAVVKFTTTVENTGNVHVQPKGVIEVKNIFGGTVAGLDINQLSGNVLPGSSRIFESVWKDPGFKFGYYTASVTLAYGNPSQTITSTTSFWIIPWMTLLIALIVIAVILAILIFAIKRYNRWIVARAQNQNNPK